ncbi:VOC family protein [Tengunoibacter tsumagoiensis]|uniref:VOC domain-containing protein n=1 Tax=Tengunoibacter tsumagoiensis TaxID=2014871 RepID=A0A401ZVV1_9CHLR|nr:VOC family protein [Tengunoibacter tsumagoiensis]GCE11031.1 hypothetical protein KTT_08900 [Tengunoibacter tsumagoiensis]
MNLTFEAVVIPVSDVDRAKEFYEKTMGFRVDIDYSSTTYEKALGFRYPGAANYRIVQLTPPGSKCSIQIGTGITKTTPGTYQGLYLVTSNIEDTRAELVARGVNVSEPFHFSSKGQTPGIAPDRADYNSFMTFSDPDGNGWLIQEIQKRAPGR